MEDDQYNRKQKKKTMDGNKKLQLSQILGTINVDNNSSTNKIENTIGDKINSQDVKDQFSSS